MGIKSISVTNFEALLKECLKQRKEREREEGREGVESGGGRGREWGERGEGGIERGEDIKRKNDIKDLLSPFPALDFLFTGLKSLILLGLIKPCHQ